MDIVERLRDTTGIHEDLIYEAADTIEQLQSTIKTQANAVRVLHEAETSELNRLRKNAQEAYTAKATLDSEREANKILTDEIERLLEVLKELEWRLKNQLYDAAYETVIHTLWPQLKEKE